MCRLFGSRSTYPSPVHHSLVEGSNALRVQSREHPDGWGIGYFQGGAPALHRGTAPAFADADFERISAGLSSEAVVAHVRKASIGKVCLENTHPFSAHGWLFAHNGTTADFDQARPRLEALLDDELCCRPAGDTDSERCFFLFLTHLRRLRGSPRGATVEEAALALARTAANVLRVAPGRGGKRSSLTFLATDGDALVALRLGRTLCFCERTRRGPKGEIRQLAIASEPISQAEPWIPLEEGELLGTDRTMVARRLRLADLVPDLEAGGNP